MKACTKCGPEKPLKDFGRDRRRRDGRQSCCLLCHRIANERWREKNPDHHREWYLEHRDAELAKQKEWREANPEKQRAIAREQYLSHRDGYLARANAYREVNREKTLEYCRKWRKLNPERERELGRKSESKRRARKMALYVEDVDPQIVLKRDEGICGICGELVDPAAWHLDHVVPLALGGPHSYDNVQPAHPVCNIRKGGRSKP